MGNLLNVLAPIWIILVLCSCSGGVAEGSAVAENAVAENQVECETVSSVSYAKNVLPILEEHCLECHNTESYSREGDGHLLQGYANFKKKVDEKMVIGNIMHLQGYVKMPYRRAKLDTCDILTVVTWINEGALEN